MKQKLADNELDTVSGGNYVNESEENAKKLDKMICPVCGNQLVAQKAELKTTVHCYSCGGSWINTDCWKKYVSSGC